MYIEGGTNTAVASHLNRRCAFYASPLCGGRLIRRMQAWARCATSAPCTAPRARAPPFWDDLQGHRTKAGRADWHLDS